MFSSEDVVPALLRVYIVLNLARVLLESSGMKVGNEGVHKNSKISCFDSRVRY